MCFCFITKNIGFCICFTDYPIQTERYGQYLQKARLYSKLLVKFSLYL